MTRLHLTLPLAFVWGCTDLEPPVEPSGEEVVGLFDGSEVRGDPAPPGSAGLVADPSGVVTTGWCFGNYSLNGTAARVYWPANGGCGSTVESPMVVMLNGFGFEHTDYHYLLRHLAKNGYIGVSIDAIPNGVTEGAYEAAAEKARDFIEDFMISGWSKSGFVDQDSVALIGHSRGGEVVRFLAEDLKAHPTLSVRSVISLAPTHHHDIPLDGSNTASAMVIVGSMDGDTTAMRAYQAHDGAGSDASQLDPAFNPLAIWRAMKLMEGAGHGGFAADVLSGHVAQGYALAFLNFHLKGDLTYYDDYVRGDSIPAGWGSSITTQYSDGLLRRTVDNFDDGLIANPTIGGAVTFPAGSASVANLATSVDSPHATRVLWYRPPANGGAVRWTLPAGKRNQSSYKYLSLRVGQSAGVATDDLRVRIFNSGVSSAWVRVTDHGTLPQRMNMCLNVWCISQDDQIHMGTIRIPLDDLGPHADVTTIEIGATSEATDGEFMIDNVEFSELIGFP